MNKNYFEGWYLKQENNSETVAIIPAYHVDNKGRASASLQVITNSQSYFINYASSSFYIDRKKLFIRLDKSIFSKYGCIIDVSSKDCNLKGNLDFSSFTPPSYDIMGPFSILPFMECRHSVFSLSHQVNGYLFINENKYLFKNGKGYMEGDSGVSFPKRYIWTHCSHGNNSIMLSVADIPFGPFGFVGAVGFIYWNNIEYRIASYCGMKVLYISNNNIWIKQGKLTLKIRLITSSSQLLYAPDKGSMSRFIRESASCQVEYSCTINNKKIFHFISQQASFENNWTNHI